MPSIISRKTLVVFVLAVCATAGNLLSRDAAMAPEQVRRVAFTVEFTETIRNFKRGTARTVNHVYAVRTDGSAAEKSIALYPDGTSEESRSVLMIPERKYIVIRDAVAAMTTQYLSPAAAIRRSALPADSTCKTAPTRQVDIKVLGTGTFLGFPVVQLLETHGPNDRTRTEVWRAPDLNCYPLKTITQFRRDDGTIGDSNEQAASKVTLAEPDPSWFGIPSGYTERVPSAVELEVLRRQGVKPPASFIQSLARIDRNYQDSQRFKPQ